jgi:hypothetical protein
MNNYTLPLKSMIGLCVTVVALIACSLFTSISPERSYPEMKKVIVHITIDDQVINAGDPYDVIDPVWWTANIYGDWHKYDDSFKIFSEEQRYLLAIAWHVAEVNNGGHHQFYFNSTGIVWQDALAGYKAIGIEAAAGILNESAELMGGSPSLNRWIRQRQLNDLQPNFDELDDRFYDLQETIDFSEVMITYIKQHRDAFYFDGNVEKYEHTNK